MSAPAPLPKRTSPWVVVLALLGLAAAGFGAWALLRPKPPEAKIDLVAATHANARGIAYMEQFDLKHDGVPAQQKAIESFEEAVRLAPDWIPARINLGIALLNTQVPDNLDRALKLFKEVLEKEPDNPHAHFCTGIILHYRNNLAEAGKFFKTVTELDPNDAHAWFWRGKCVPNESEAAEAKEYYEKALKLNPYLNAARYSLAQHRLLAEDEKRKKALLDEFEALKKENAQGLADLKYAEMGRYGDVIGKSPAPPPDLGMMPMFDSVKGPAVKLADGTAWAAPDKLDELRKAVRARFGGSVLLFDYNRDAKPDVLLLGAVTRGGEARDLLLRNDGNNAFTDATAEAGLEKHAGSLGGAVGDFDNDGFPDLALAGPSGVKLFRNAGGKSFEDKTAAAGFDKEPAAFLTAAWFDLDQDGDLDLVAAKHARTPDLALKQLKGEKVEGNGRLAVFANAGVSPPSPAGTPLLPLTCAFQPVTAPEALLVKGAVTGVVTTDVDGDLDIDLVVLADGQAPVTVLNDRLLRFRSGESVTTATANWAGGLVLDANGDDQPDLVLVEPGAAPRVLVSKRDDPGESVAARFAPGGTDSPALRSAAWCDLDLDGRTDVVGLSADRKPVFLQGDGKGKFAKKAAPFGPEADAIPDLLAAIPADLDGDGNPDLLAWSEAGGLRVFRSLGNGNHALKLTLTGTRERVTSFDSKWMRTNSDGVGCWVRVHAGPLRTAAESTTLFAGLGQSRLPLHLGLGKAETADVVRVRWPDSIVQAELNRTAGAVVIGEMNRKGSSCPILFAWDGERFAYVTDFLGAGSMGESGPDGSTRPPRPEESVKIEPGRLVPKNGKFVLKLTEPMDEVMYLDRVRLDVIDHPAGVSVFPDERLATSGPQPSQDRLFFRDSERVFPAKATDHKGRDLTATLRDRDGKHADGFAVRSWLGFAEDHFVEFDFDGQLKALPAGRKVYLVLAGWTDYAFPESIFAATQAGVPTVWPVLEQKQPDGTWKTLGEIGIPAGLTRVMTKEVTGWIDPAGGPVRIRTNLRIYWDQVFVAPTADGLGNSVRELPVSRGSLEHRGFSQEYRPGGKLPIAYDYDRLEPVLVTRWRGKLTRTGDVTELLKETDDRHVLCGPGDEVTAEFDAASLPPVREGWQRSFVLRTWGYVKDTAPTTLTAGQVGPLPHRAMPGFPYDPAKNPPPAHVTEYDRLWNTRPPGRR
jgi:tetratricopeptide (TPR) repeat protein